MEQRKRESLIPKGTFEIGAPPADELLADDQRGDLSGTFLRSEVEPLATPVARIELKRKPVPPPPPAAARKSLRPAPPTLLPTMVPPPPPSSRVPTTTPEAGSLRALVAPSYPPPAPPAANAERIDFLEFALRLDVAPMPPPPSSLLPPPAEAPSRSLRPVLVVLALLAFGAVGWLSRGWLAAPVQASPRPRHVVAAAPVIAPATVTAPSAVAPAVTEQVIAPSVVEPNVIEPALVAPAPVVTPVLSVVTEPRVTAVEHAAVDEAPAAVQDAPLAAVETAVEVSAEATADVEHAPSMTDAVAEALPETLPETLEREEVVEGIEILRNEYQACAGDKHGTAEIKLTIANTGRITHALVGGDFAGTPQGSCLARTLRQARFRSFLQPRLEIAYPIAL